MKIIAIGSLVADSSFINDVVCLSILLPLKIENIAEASVEDIIADNNSECKKSHLKIKENNNAQMTPVNKTPILDNNSAGFKTFFKSLIFVS
ncbi:MAG: hypothetical protein BWX61_00784 [Bacteroidetes bacterium ADurb.Bin035]|nr:MAG: hypothetical protein BWX61_00784 [Bacteroidetes bacterium ADurb.Bin035]